MNFPVEASLQGQLRGTVSVGNIDDDTWYRSIVMFPGALSFRDVSLRYKPGQQAVLHGISWSLLPQEKVGVVGRTGAGKSSIITALFRLHEPEGESENE